MKKSLLVFCFFGVFNVSYGQTNTFPPTGKVGIGTTAPQDLLEIKTGASRQGITLIGDGSTEAYHDIMFSINNKAGISSSKPYAWVLSHRKDGYFSNTPNGESSLEFYAVRSTGYYAPLSFKSNGDVILASTKNAAPGNVGIGTTDPSAKLHINSYLTDAAIKIGSPNDAGNINVPVGASTGGYNVDFYTWRDMVPDQIGGRIRAERINSFQPNNALVQSMDIAFYTSIGISQSDLTERLRISGAGNVSIGTKDSKGYKLAVNGNILATEIKVQAAPWPDYVFSKSYKLPALHSVEKHIKAEGYLPDMPSAKEVESNGINVGEMNVKLLKKIEELTLYLIDLDKKVNKLDAENKELKGLLLKSNTKSKK